MPPIVEDRLRDILEAITEIEDVMRGASFDQFAPDRRARLLTERLLEIVCEASRTIPDKIKQDEPGIDWRKMIDFGNLLRQACLPHDQTRNSLGHHPEPFAAFEVVDRTPHWCVGQMMVTRVQRR
jgi:uncharacterized protein with HEPN domain